jgi:hypothetical protein
MRVGAVATTSLEYCLVLLVPIEATPDGIVSVA